MENSKNHYTERPENCAICGGKLSFGKMENFGLDPYQSGYCYYCNGCGNYIVTHKNRHKDAIGTIADAQTKYLRMQCHEKMDKMWETSSRRRFCYVKMAKALGIKYEDCHFGHMDKEMLKKALDILEEWERTGKIG